MRQDDSPRTVIKYLIVICMLLIAIVVAINLGTMRLTWNDTINIFRDKISSSGEISGGISGEISGEISDEISAEMRNEQIRKVIFDIRLPRIFMSILVGGLLSAIGVVMQGIFKNKMAEPSVLGVSGGAALGASLVMALGFDYVIIFGEFSVRYLGAIIGAMVTFIVLITLSFGGRYTRSKMGGSGNSAVLLSGIALSYLTSSLVTVIMSLNHEKMDKIYSWLLGSFAGSTAARTGVLAALMPIMLGALVYYAPQIDILKLGKVTAQSYGIDADRLVKKLMFISSVVVAFCVSSVGVIGFVGLVVPHVVTLLGIRKTRARVVMSFLVGALFVLVSDTVARTIVAPSELPAGAIISLVGAPYFLILTIRDRDRGDFCEN